MNLTKLLCKYFDDEDKGYVTLGDIAAEVLGWVLLITLGAAATFVIGGAYLRGALLIYNGAPTTEEIMYSDGGGCVLLCVVASMGAVVLIASYIVSKLAPIRVVTCERTEGDE